MYTKNNKVIGIVGGMGPEASLNLCQYILKHTPARTDQQHLPTIHISYPNLIEDRSIFLEGKTDINPGYNISKIIRKLYRAGATVIGIPCNTAHAPEIYQVIENEMARKQCPVKLVHMPRVTCKYVYKKFGSANRVGLIASNGTFKSKLYEHIFRHMGIELIVPEYDFQNDVIQRMVYDPVYGIKANCNSVSEEVLALLNQTLTFFKAEKVQVIVLGCTEISLALKCREWENIHLVDSNEILARALIQEVTRSAKSQI